MIGPHDDRSFSREYSGTVHHDLSVTARDRGGRPGLVDLRVANTRRATDFVLRRVYAIAGIFGGLIINPTFNVRVTINPGILLAQGGFALGAMFILRYL
jgi:hypothetical protein